MLKFKKLLVSLSLCFGILPFSFCAPSIVNAFAESDSLSFVIYSGCLNSVNIGDELYPIQITAEGETPVFKSSSPSVASIDDTGKVTAKKAGSTTITAKFSNAETSCKITVVKTAITLNKKTASIEHGETITLSATVSTASQVTWKSSKTSVATVDKNGVITGKKPGTTTITASADGSKATCTITVKSPSLSLNKSSIVLYRSQTASITAKVSSNLLPSFKSNKKSVATVDENGRITAVKHGTAVITATIDGVSKTCTVTVKQPEISLNASELTLSPGSRYPLKATVSSGNTPVFSSSNSSIASVDENGIITALQKGTAYIYANEDGIKVKCKVKVTESED
ncbi:MAG: hypothetical protein E7256_13790 [Lachnospiraceae bacterium]|nr:hypothetical protein [Lachnospiraceae bacterium]